MVFKKGDFAITVVDLVKDEEDKYSKIDWEKWKIATKGVSGASISYCSKGTLVVIEEGPDSEGYYKVSCVMNKPHKIFCSSGWIKSEYLKKETNNKN